MRRLVAIGDIHGHLSKLDAILDILQPCDNDQLIFLGDYVDRGPDSRGVIERLLLLQADFPQTVFLRGNHEQMFLDALVSKGLRQAPTLREQSAWFQQDARGTDIQLFLANGGVETIKNYGWGWDVPLEHIAFLEATKLWWRYAEFLFVHAGCLDAEPGELDPWILLWSRFCEPGSDGEIHVVGHAPLESGQPKFEEGRIWLDTGAAYGGPLTACDVMTGEIWQVR